jgi:transposase
MNVPKGEEYLKEHSKEELVGMYREEKDGRAKIRLLAAILRKEGKTLKEISDIIKYPLTTIKGWLHGMYERGIERAHPIKQSGRPRELAEKELRELDLILSEPPTRQNLPLNFWDTKLVIQFVKERYGVEYSYVQMWRILRRLGFTCRKPRPVHRKASRPQQETFKKTSGKGSASISERDGRSYIWTKTSSP